MLGRQQSDQPVLGVVGVLVLVDQDVAEAVLVVRQHLGEGTEQLDRHHQQVVEVHGVHGEQLALVPLVDVGRRLAEAAAGSNTMVSRSRSKKKKRV